MGEGGGGKGGGGGSHIKRMRVLVGNFEKNPKMHQGVVLRAWRNMFFPLLRGINS